MKKSRFTEGQILAILKSQEQGKKVSDISREHGISQGTFSKWKSKYSGMEASDMKRLKELESENARLKQLYADRGLEIEALKDVLSKKW